MGKFVWPLPGHTRISSPYGWRNCPFHGKEFHTGVDIPAASGTPILAARSGTVAEARYAGSYGNMVYLNHGGSATRYGHMTKYVVKAGQAVTAGQTIGYVGSTGNSTGPHLHFEVYVNGSRVNPINYVAFSDTVKDYSGGGAVSSVNGMSAETDAAAAVVHIPQVEKVWTVYETDTPYKPPDAYRVVWQSYTTGQTLDITPRVASPEIKDDAAAVCMELTFSVMQAVGEKFMPVLNLECGDYVSVTNTGSGECVFLGQIQRVAGSYRGSVSVTCHDGGRVLTGNEIIIQFGNISAYAALSAIANKVGISTFSCPNLVSSVNGTEKANAAEIAQNILDTVSAENGVPYFLRMMGNTLVVRSFGQVPIIGYCRQESNLAAMDILDEAADIDVSRDIADLRNSVSVYSDQDDSVQVLATEEDAASIRRYGKRTALETYSDSDGVSAAYKARKVLSTRNTVAETLTLSCYGTDRVMAGVRLSLNLAEAKGDYWVEAVTHQLSVPHRMSLTLRRCTA